MKLIYIPNKPVQTTMCSRRPQIQYYQKKGVKTIFTTITDQRLHLGLFCLTIKMQLKKVMVKLFQVYKVCLLLFKANNKSKYAYVILLYLVQIVAILSKKDAHSLKWNRFYNKHGTKAGNIPLDLRMEQMNKIVKTM